jgi:hypothetical protein
MNEWKDPLISFLVSMSVAPTVTFTKGDWEIPLWEWVIPELNGQMLEYVIGIDSAPGVDSVVTSVGCGPDPVPAVHLLNLARREILYTKEMTAVTICPVPGGRFITSDKAAKVFMWEVLNQKICGPVWEIQCPKIATHIFCLQPNTFGCLAGKVTTVYNFDGEPLCAWAGPENNSLIPLPGDQVACCDCSKDVYIRNVKTGEIVNEIKAPGDTIDTFFVPHVGLFVGGITFFNLYNSDSIQEITSAPGHVIFAFNLFSESMIAAITESLNLLLYDFRNSLLHEMELSFINVVNDWCNLGNGNIIFSGTGKIVVLDLNLLKWKSTFFWVFLGHGDPGSIFFRIPIEVISHMTECTWNLNFINLPRGSPELEETELHEK